MVESMEAEGECTMKYDPKIVIWIVGVIFISGGGWWNLRSVSNDMARIQETLDSQSTTVAVHVANPEAHDDMRIKKLETQQAEVANDVKSLMINQHAICQATNARCK